MQIKWYVYSTLLAFLILPLSANEVKTKQKVVILNFKPLNVSRGLSDAVYENFITSLASTNSFLITERSQLDAIINEMKLTSSDEFADDQVIQIGKLAKAEIAFIGSITRLGSKYTINIRAIEIETGNIVLAKTAKADSEDNLPSAIDEIIEAFSPQSHEEPKTVSSDSVNPEIIQPDPELKKLYEKFNSRRNSGIGLLVSGFLLSSLLIPGVLAIDYSETELNGSGDSTKDSMLYQGVSTLGYLCVLTGVIGAILFVIGLPVTISSIIIYSTYRAALKKNYTVIPFFDNQQNLARAGLSISFAL